MVKWKLPFLTILLLLNQYKTSTQTKTRWFNTVTQRNAFVSKNDCSSNDCSVANEDYHRNYGVLHFTNIFWKWNRNAYEEKSTWNIWFNVSIYNTTRNKFTIVRVSLTITTAERTRTTYQNNAKISLDNYSKTREILDV